jgi:hypothetical protein
LSDDTLIPPEDTIGLELGCVTGRTPGYESGVNNIYTRRTVTTHYQITTVRLKQPARNRVVEGVVCERCGATLDVVVLSRQAVWQKLFLAPLLFVVLPGVILLAILPCVLDSETGLAVVGITGLAVAIVGIWLAVRRMPAFNDWLLGGKGIAVEWWEETREQDFDAQEGGYRHILWAAPPNPKPTAGNDPGSEAPPPEE